MRSLTASPVSSSGVFKFSFPASLYTSARPIKEEYLYVLQRQQESARVGIMLQRPTLLLNEKFHRDTEFDSEPSLGGKEGGDSYGDNAHYYASPTGSMRNGQQNRNRPTGVPNGGDGNMNSMEFLQRGSSTILNLSPDEAGVVRVPRSKLGVHHSSLLVLVVGW